MNEKRLAIAERGRVGIALAAILVQAPRLVLAVLAADRLPVAVDTERALLVVAGLGTALVLTGGNLYLAHTIPRVRRWRRALATVWLVVLAASGCLVVPLVAAGLHGRTLPELLHSETLSWGWSLLAALAHEVTAAGCVLAAAAVAAAGERTDAERSHAREVEELLRQRDAARRELAAERQGRAGRVARAAGSGARAAGSGARVAPSKARAAGSDAPEPATPLACPAGCGRSFAGKPALAGDRRRRVCVAWRGGGGGERQPAAERVRCSAAWRWQLPASCKQSRSGAAPADTRSQTRWAMAWPRRGRHGCGPARAHRSWFEVGSREAGATEVR